MKTYDYAVCGMGMAGCALAGHMAARLPEAASVLLLEPRRHFQRDKSWCFWHLQRELMDDAISHRWPRWRVRWGKRSIEHESLAFPYVHIDSGEYYRQALTAVAERGRFDLQLGTKVTSLAAQSGGVTISAGDAIYNAGRAFDTRPLTVPRDTLLQHFRGWEVVTEHPVFEPDTVTTSQPRKCCSSVSRGRVSGRVSNARPAL